MSRKDSSSSDLLVLVTLGLVAFGLVMVYSATSASAALGAGDPMNFLVKQGSYALVGLALLVVASRIDYHRLRIVAPMLLVGALVLRARGARGRARRSTARAAGSWSGRSASSRPSSPRSRSCIWVCALLARASPCRRRWAS